MTLRKDMLVEIVAYCLMPNHFHVILGTQDIGNKTKFIHKLCTGYSMYFNLKYGHSGTIFQGQYKAKYIDNDDYFRYVIQYVHLNPYGLLEPDMDRITKLDHSDEAIKFSKEYEFSSYRDYLGLDRPQKSILTFVQG